MKLYAVYNGYEGNGPVHVLVIATDEDQAKERARQEFEAQLDTYPMYRTKHHADYANAEKFQADLLCGALTMPWVGDVQS